KSRSRSAAGQERGDWVTVNEDSGAGFVGYDTLECSTSITRYREIKEAKGTQYQLVLATTPFYAESGGQVGDQGVLISDKETIQIIDTKKENDLTVHLVEKLPAYPEEEFIAKVDGQRREAIKNNHSATHLLQAALKEVLGDHIQQKGSLVNEQLLRFDFSHYAKLTEEEITAVEAIVNAKIRQNIELDERRNVPIDEAKQMGATALFGEKYGEYVRVIAFDPNFSVELCGGTHVNATGQVGLFKILSESSISAGVRRIEAVTGAAALHYVHSQLELIKEIRELLRNPKNVKNAIESLVQDKNELKKELESLQLKQTAALKEDLKKTVQQIDGVNMIIQQVSLPNADTLKKLVFELKNELKPLVAVLAADIEGKPQIAVVVEEELVASKSWNA